MPTPAYRQNLRSRDNSPRRRNENSQSSDRETVTVFCRIRQVSGGKDHKSHKNEEYTIESTSQESDTEVEETDNNYSVCKIVDPKTVQLTTIDKRKDCEVDARYTFTQAFSPSVGQKPIFDTTARPLVDRLIEGGNGLLFAYGVTGSGKTYTMMGSKQKPGVLPQCLNMLFSSIGNYQTNKYEIKPADHNEFFIQPAVDAMQDHQEQALNGISKYSRIKDTTFNEESVNFDFAPCTSDKVNVNARYAVFIQFVEIYNDRVYDLLDENARYLHEGYDSSSESSYKINGAQHSKKIREDKNNHTYVDGVKEIEVKSITEAFEQYHLGKERRRLAQTELNFTSSRSHSIFQIRLVRVPVSTKSGDIHQDSRLLEISRLALVDLAGSERVSRTGATGSTLSEASNINTSLMALRRCVEALRRKQRGHDEFIPFRQKKIVHLFKPFFEGEGKISILICVNPLKSEAQETEHVLSFAESVKRVQTKKEEVRQFDMEAIERRKADLEEKDRKRKEDEAERKRDLQRRIKGAGSKLNTGSKNNQASNKNITKTATERSRFKSATQDSDIETESETGITSDYTIESCEFQLPDNLGNPPPVCQAVEMHDDKTFPKVLAWLLERKEKMQEIGSVMTRTMPVHVKNLKGLVSQYENHRNHFEEVSDRYNEVCKELECTKKTNKRLDAKNITYQKQIGKLEREKADSGMAINEKDARIREITRQVRTQRQELDKQLGMAERKHKMETDKAVRGAVATTEARLKSREAKLAQLKHVLDKTKFDGNVNGGGNDSPPAQNSNSRPNTRNQANNDRQSPQTNNNKVQNYINKQNLEQNKMKNSAENPFNNPLSGNEKTARYIESLQQHEFEKTPTNSPKRYSGEHNTSYDSIFRKHGDDLDQSIESVHFSSSDFTKFVDQNNNKQGQIYSQRYNREYYDQENYRQENYAQENHNRKNSIHENCNQQSYIHEQYNQERYSQNNNLFQNDTDFQNNNEFQPKICDTPTRSKQYQVHVGRRPFSASPSKKKHRAPSTPTSSSIQRSISQSGRSKPRYIEQPRPSCGAPPVNHPAPLRRRSRSADAKTPYLSHKPQECIPTKTLLQPNCKVSKHVHIPTEKDLATHKKYLLTAQDMDSEGEIQTKFMKGDILRTRKMPNGDAGIAVQFTDMEILKTKDPQNFPSPNRNENNNNHNFSPSPFKRSHQKKRQSDTPLEELDSNVGSQWTDVATRCQTAVEYSKGSNNLPPTVKHIK